MTILIGKLNQIISVTQKQNAVKHLNLVPQRLSLLLLFCVIFYSCRKKDVSIPIPNTPTNLQAPAKTSTSITLQWDASAAATGYRLYKGNIIIYEGKAQNYIDTGLSASTIYNYSISAFNLTGESAKSAIVSLKTNDPPIVIPSSPTGLSSVLITPNSVGLKWNSVSTATSYKLYKANIIIYEGTAIEYTDNGLNASTSYNYSVSALNSAGESARSAIVALKTNDPPIVIPSSPTGLSSVLITPNSVGLKWNSVSTATSYKLYKANIIIYEGTAIEYTDNGLNASTSYNYSVSALNSAGESARSAIVSLKTSDLISSTTSVHLILGNPTNATTNIINSNNYLIVKPQYALSYNNTKRHANWVSWELSKSWLGAIDRQDNFQPDATLPTGWYRVVTADYTNSGFDRGHLCPSADRTKTVEDNSSTFLMTNIAAQAPDLNRKSWEYLEQYCRDVVKTGYTAYILAGATGTGGEGSNGYMTVLKNNVNVPEKFYKVIVFTPTNTTVNTNSVVVAVNFANTVKDNQSSSWLKYVTTPLDIEQKSSTTLFSSLPASVSSVLKNKKFDMSTSTLDVDAAVGTYNTNILYLGPRGGCYYINSNNNKTYVDRSFCQ